MPKKGGDRKKKQVLRQGVSARILVPILQELTWAEQQHPYLSRSELIQTAIAFYVRELRKWDIETGSWFPRVELGQNTAVPDRVGQLCRHIEQVWKAHEVAEHNQNIADILPTLLPSCVYELPQSGHRWEAHKGATRFYTEFFRAFPDFTLDAQHVVIGPHGVSQELHIRATHERD